LHSSGASSAEPLVTIHISKRAGWLGLVAVALLVTLIAFVLTRQKVQPNTREGAKATMESKPAPPMPLKVRSATSGPKTSDKQTGVENVSTHVAVPNEAHTTTYPSPSMEREYPAPAALTPTISAPVAFVPALVGELTLNGAGATFPYPIYSKWFSEFHELNSGIQINYMSIGSGAGIRQLLEGTVDFGASDLPMTEEQLAQAHSRILHIPTVLGAVVPIYNVPGLSGEIKFSPEILAGIYLGKITSWNDAAIVKVNPQANLPNEPIVVVHRSDGCATTFAFTDYLSKVNSEWNGFVGNGTTVQWPIGIGAKGNEGVAGVVRQVQGAIGYVDLIYAMQNKISFGSIRNASGRFVAASLASITEAAASVTNVPADFRISITNAPGKDSYPIASFTWLLIPMESGPAVKGKVMAAFLNWMIADGEAMAKGLGYAPLPSNIAAAVRERLAQFR
jgi:phosphate transport system substrate-binding protein